MAAEIVMPKLGLTMTEGTVEKWFVKEGDEVAQDDPIVEISSEKLTNEVLAPEAGVIIKIVAEEGDVIPSRGVMAYIGKAGESVGGEAAEEAPEKPQAPKQEAQEKAAEQPPAKAPSREEGERIFITPVARKMAEEKGIDIRDVNGTGGNGRITRLDIDRYVPAAVPAEKAPEKAAAGTQEYGAGLQGMRKTIAERMMRSVHTTARVTNQRKVDVTQLMAFRKEIEGKVNEPLTNGELSINTLLAKAVILALKETPEMNAWYYDGEYVQMEEVHLGIATALEEGLVVPVVRDAHQMALSQLGPAIRKVASDARQGTLDGDLYSGSTFSITNLGGYEIEYFTPIINTPEVGILGVGALQKELELDDDGGVVQKLKLPLSLSYDHQIIDGAPAAEFLSKIAAYLQDPYRLLI